MTFSGILHDDGTIDNEASIKRLAEVAVAYAKAGTSLTLSSGKHMKMSWFGVINAYYLASQTLQMHLSD